MFKSREEKTEPVLASNGLNLLTIEHLPRYRESLLEHMSLPPDGGDEFNYDTQPKKQNTSHSSTWEKRKLWTWRKDPESSTTTTATTAGHMSQSKKSSKSQAVTVSMVCGNDRDSGLASVTVDYSNCDSVES